MARRLISATSASECCPDSDGKSLDLKKKAREVAYVGATKQSEENLSDKSVEAIVVELKPGAPKAKGWPGSLDQIELK